MPEQKECFGAAVVNGKIYVIGGYPGVGYYPFSNITQMYNPANDDWITLAPMPTARINFGIAISNNKIYVIGGQDDENMITTPEMSYQFEVLTGINEAYDPTTNSWDNKASMPIPRNHLQANVVEDKIYLIGGQHQQSIELPPSEHSSNLTEVYDPTTDKWTTMTPIPNPVYSYCSAVVDDKIYIISGAFANSSLSNLVQIFDPKTNTWTLGAPIPTPMQQAAAGATTGTMAPKRIYVIGGNTTQAYNPKTDTWTFGADMPTYRYGLSVAVVNDTLFALGGSAVSLTDANEQYTPIDYGTPDPTQQPTTTPTQTPTESPTINPSPTIPEFQTWTIPTLATAIILISTITVRRKKLKHQS
jgi:hypothetical protein